MSDSDDDGDDWWLHDDSHDGHGMDDDGRDLESVGEDMIPLNRLVQGSKLSPTPTLSPQRTGRVAQSLGQSNLSQPKGSLSPVAAASPGSSSNGVLMRQHLEEAEAEILRLRGIIRTMDSPQQQKRRNQSPPPQGNGSDTGDPRDA